MTVKETNFVVLVTDGSNQDWALVKAPDHRMAASRVFEASAWDYATVIPLPDDYEDEAQGFESVHTMTWRIP